MPRFQPGDYVKAEFRDDLTGEGERMWVVVDSCDDEAGVLFGRLDNEPVLGTGLHLGDELAASYGKVVEHRKAAEFDKQQEATAAFCPWQSAVHFSDTAMLEGPAATQVPCH
jgi:hypothetical protein